jgi:hypothetical protein
MYPTVGRIVLNAEATARFYSKLASSADRNGCRLWMASTDANGYGQFATPRSLGRRTVKAHLVAWQLERGGFPQGLEPDHLCNVRRCTAVDHLEWVTHEENNRRITERATHCRSGRHRWDEQVPIARGRGRECRPCRNAGKRKRYAMTGVR